MIYEIDPSQCWRTTDLDCAVAEELFGWRWLSYVGIPVRGTPGYPQEQRVKRFFPPESEMGKASTLARWKDYWDERECAPATGDEPLAYCYSSNGPHEVPHFSGHSYAVEAMQKEIDRRGLWERYEEILAAQIGDGSGPAKQFAGYEAECIAALAAVGSKYVIDAPTNTGQRSTLRPGGSSSLESVAPADQRPAVG